MNGGVETNAGMNAFTVDLEEWFCSHALAASLPPCCWDAIESRVERPTHALLELLARHSAHATFFVLGWVAERHSRLVRTIAEAGHEIASHGYEHARLHRLTRNEARADIQRSISVLADITGMMPRGYRAPAFSITRRTLWALDLLNDIGFTYDSSIFPIAHHPDYGIPDAALGVHHHNNGLLEVPPSCVELVGTRVPCAGGGYFRHMPYGITRNLIDRVLRDGRPYIFYIHPWELDADLPTAGLTRRQRFRLHHNIHLTGRKLQHLLRDYTFTSINALPELARQKERSTDVGLLSRGGTSAPPSPDDRDADTVGA